jgi:hypothetical protein
VIRQQVLKVMSVSVAIIIRHAKGKHYKILLLVAPATLRHFYALSQKRNVLGFSRTYFCTSRILVKLQFSRQIFETYSVSNFMKLFTVGSKFFHTYRRTDIKKLIVALCNFGSEPRIND